MLNNVCHNACYELTWCHFKQKLISILVIVRRLLGKSRAGSSVISRFDPPLFGQMTTNSLQQNAWSHYTGNICGLKGLFTWLEFSPMKEAESIANAARFKLMSCFDFKVPTLHRKIFFLLSAPFFKKVFDISLVSANQLSVMSHRALVPHWVLMWPCRPPPCRTTLRPPRSPMLWCTTSVPTSRGWRCWVSQTLLFVTLTHINAHNTPTFTPLHWQNVLVLFLQIHTSLLELL